MKHAWSPWIDGLFVLGIIAMLLGGSIAAVSATTDPPVGIALVAAGLGCMFAGAVAWSRSKA
jgi:hypothetical protein